MGLIFFFGFLNFQKNSLYLKKKIILTIPPELSKHADPSG